MVALPLPLPEGHQWGRVIFSFVHDEIAEAERAPPFRWLYEHCREPWHWNVLAYINTPNEYRVTSKRRPRMEDTHLCFHFESRTDAILFKLTWGGV